MVFIGRFILLSLLYEGPLSVVRRLLILITISIFRFLKPVCIYNRREMGHRVHFICITLLPL